MKYFTAVDMSMEATHLCVVDRDGAVIHQTKVTGLSGILDRANREATAWPLPWVAGRPDRGS